MLCRHPAESLQLHTMMNRCRLKKRETLRFSEGISFALVKQKGFTVFDLSAKVVFRSLFVIVTPPLGIKKTGYPG